MTAPVSMWNDTAVKTAFDEEVRSFNPMT
jgi:hypothetical protein